MGKRTPRASKLETEQRVFTIQGWILKGVPDYLIRKNITQTWPIELRQAKNLLRKAYETWHDEEVATIEQRRQMRIDELKQEIRNMKEEYRGTPKGMLAVNSIRKEITKLEGLYRTKTITLEGNAEKPIVFATDEDKERRIKELMAKAGQIYDKG